MTNNLVAQARTWIGTPFHHQGRLKGKGCDCLGMLIGIASELELKTTDGKLIASLDNINYSSTPNTTELLSKMNDHLLAVSNIDTGDIVLMKIEGNPQHVGIISDYIYGGFGIIHSLHGQGVVEHLLNGAWQKRIYKVYQWQQ